MTSNQNTHDDDALVRITTAANQRPVFYALPELRAAASLLRDMWAAGRNHGVSPDEWGYVSNLPTACLDVLTSKLRRNIPTTAARAVELLDAVAFELNAAGMQASRNPNELEVALPRTATTPEWGRDGKAQLAVSISDGGWGLVVTGPDINVSPVRRVYASFDVLGARAVAEIAGNVNRGVCGNVFAEPPRIR